MTSLFADWIEAVGLNRKQVSRAGEMLGLSTVQAVARNRGKKEPTLAERLAMSAIRAGLPPWSPDDDEELARLARRRRPKARAA